MAQKTRHVTKWNVLALLVALAGAAVTIGVSQAYINYWAGTGQKYSPALPNTIELPAGRSLVYYESMQGVPSGGVMLYLFGPDGERYFPGRPRDDQSYHAFLSGMSGRALWELDLPVAGMYSFRTYNGNVLSDGDIPIDDRLTFLKTPGTLSDVRAVQTAIQVTGASTTLAFVAVLYLLHLRRLQHHRAALATDSEADDVESDELEDDLFINAAEA